LILFQNYSNISIVNTVNETNLKRVLKDFPDGVVITSKELERRGIYYDLQRVYEKSGWLKRIAQGAYVKLNQSYTMDGAIYALQTQLGLSIHIGGYTALNDLYGKTHNLYLVRSKQLFGNRGEKLPQWFKNVYNDEYDLNICSFLPKELGMTANGNTLVSSMERAILEMIYLTPKKYS
jgi:hypothetical protein